MRRNTLSLLRCVSSKKCGGELLLRTTETEEEVSYGSLACKKCKAEYPVLAGVAVIVPDVPGYLIYHVKGVSKFVPNDKIPKSFRKEFAEAKAEIVAEHIEEDLESDRVNSLYLMNHYLNVEGSKEKWWKAIHSDVSPALEKLVKEYWDQGPFSVLASWFKGSDAAVVELGCGVGGIYQKIASQVSSYLGVDSSFQSILLARHFNLGIPFAGEHKIPEDLLNGAVSRKMDFKSKAKSSKSEVDFIVGEIDLLPLKKEAWDFSISMNAIDMLEDPRVLPEAQARNLKKGGHAYQSAPYIWHEKVAKKLRSHLPKTIQDSASAVEHLYVKAGFKIEKSVDHVPWLFFKHVRQIELYSVHIFSAKKI
jgi:SAM-dependent methyltransferase/uncharacterized protein YbaR (Trm112 family)